MNALEIIKEAIKQKKPIQFEYNLKGRAVGKRIGNPHAIYVASTEKVNVHIWKIDGVMTDPSQPLPTWRTYTIDHIANVQIFTDEECFETAPGYKPSSPLYSRALMKV